jgi:hypothetical protein
VTGSARVADQIRRPARPLPAGPLPAGPPEAGPVLPPPTATFAGDAEAHYLARPRHCPACGAAFADRPALVVEYWIGDARVFATWCGACSWTGEIVSAARTIGHEPGS